MARDPSHPWCGEAVAIDWANQGPADPAIDKFSDGDPIRFQFDQGQNVLCAAGQSIMGGFLTCESLLPGDAAVAAFVVEVSSAFDGTTLRLSTGVDPSFTLADPAAASDAGGVFAVDAADGAVTLVVPVPSFDVATYLAESQYTVGRVECLTGGAIINQIRLRIWPPTGPVGGWSTDVVASQDVELAPSTWGAGGGSGITENEYVASTPDGIFELASSEVMAIFGSAHEVYPFVDWTAQPLHADLFVDTGVEVRTISPEVTYSAGGTVSRTAGIALQPDPWNFTKTATPAVSGATYGLDFITPPDVVPGDLAVQLLGDPSVAWGEAEWDGLGITSVDEDRPYYTLTPLTIEEFQNPEALSIPFYGEQQLPDTPSPHPPQVIALPDSRAVMLSLSSTSATSVQGYGGPDPLMSSYHVGCSVGMTITLGDSTITVPAYRYWTPTTQADQSPMRLMQRGDTLGMGSGRTLGVGTRQAGIKVLGSY